MASVLLSSVLSGGGSVIVDTTPGMIRINSGQTGTLATITPTTGLAIRLDAFFVRDTSVQTGITVLKSGNNVVSGVLVNRNPTNANVETGQFFIGQETGAMAPLQFDIDEVITLEKDAGNTTENLAYVYTEVNL